MGREFLGDLFQTRKYFEEEKASGIYASCSSHNSILSEVTLRLLEMADVNMQSGRNFVCHFCMQKQGIPQERHPQKAFQSGRVRRRRGKPVDELNSWINF